MVDTYNVIATRDGRHVAIVLDHGEITAVERDAVTQTMSFKDALNVGSMAMKREELRGVQIVAAA